MSRRARGLQQEAPPLAPLQPPTAAMSTGWRAGLVCIFVAYVTLSCVHLATTTVLTRDTGSLINAPDESAHIGYIQLLLEENRLPTQADHPATYEWHQPPLYYLAAAPLYAGRGASGARILGVICGSVSLVLIFAAARRVFPSEPSLAVTAVGIAGLLPMRQAVYAAVGNDAMLEMWFSAALYQVVLAFTNGLTARRSCYIGLFVALAMLTKASGSLLVPVVLFALILLRKNGESIKAVSQGTGYIFTVLLVCTAGWYARNWSLYHELTPMKAFMHEFENTARAADFIGQPVGFNLWTGAIISSAPALTRPGYLELVANWTVRTFAGAYTLLSNAHSGKPSFLAPTFYLAYVLLFGAGLAGLVRLHFQCRNDFTLLQRSLIGLYWITLIVVAASFAGFVWIYFQAQGRYLYPAMLPIATLTSLGLSGILPAHVRERACGGILAVLFALAFAFVIKASSAG